MGEEIKEAPVEEAPTVKKEKKPKTPREGPLISFTGPEGAAKVIALMAALSTILQGSNLFWQGINIVNGFSIFYGLMLVILAVVLILAIDILDFSGETLKKFEWFQKLYRFEILLLIGGLILLFEILSMGLTVLVFAMLTTTLIGVLGGLLVIIAAILEMIREKDKITPSKLMVLVGCAIAVIESIFAFMAVTPADIWDGIVGIVVVILLLLSLYDKIKFMPYEWWMVLILGFVLYGWLAPGIGGTLILISFILMLLEK